MPVCEAWKHSTLGELATFDGQFQRIVVCSYDVLGAQLSPLGRYSCSALLQSRTGPTGLGLHTKGVRPNCCTMLASPSSVLGLESNEPMTSPQDLDRDQNDDQNLAGHFRRQGVIVGRLFFAGTEVGLQWIVANWVGKLLGFIQRF